MESNQVELDDAAVDERVRQNIKLYGLEAALLYDRS